jgi:serine/threonine protein phosphatase PrpC
MPLQFIEDERDAVILELAGYLPNTRALETGCSIGPTQHSFSTVVTTSNERPYTNWQGVVQAPSQDTAKSSLHPGLITVGILLGDINNSSAFLSDSITRVVRRAVLEHQDIQIKSRLDVTIQRMNYELYSHSKPLSEKASEGASALAAAVVDNTLFLAYVGNNRAYLLRSGQMQQLTVEHRWGQEQVDAGMLTEQEGLHHSLRNLPTRHMGVSSDVNVDHRIINVEKVISDSTQISDWPVMDRLWLQAEDIVILATASLSKALTNEQIAAVVSAHTPRIAADKLTKMARAVDPEIEAPVIILRLWGDADRSTEFAAPLASYPLVQYPIVLAQRSSLVAVKKPKSRTATPSPPPPPELPWYGRLYEAALLATQLLLTCFGLWVVVIFMLAPMGRSIITASAETVDRIASVTGPFVSRTIARWTGGEVVNADRTAESSQIMPSFAVRRDPTGRIANTTTVLLSPQDNIPVSGVVRFEWQTKQELPTNQAFEPILWPVGKIRSSSYLALGEISATTARIVNLDNLDLSDGEYLWGVQIVQLQPYQVIQPAEVGRLLIYSANDYAASR